MIALSQNEYSNTLLATWTEAMLSLIAGSFLYIETYLQCVQLVEITIGALNEENTMYSYTPGPWADVKQSIKELYSGAQLH